MFWKIKIFIGIFYADCFINLINISGHILYQITLLHILRNLNQHGYLRVYSVEVDQSSMLSMIIFSRFRPRVTPLRFTPTERMPSSTYPPELFRPWRARRSCSCAWRQTRRARFYIRALLNLSRYGPFGPVWL